MKNDLLSYNIIITGKRLNLYRFFNKRKYDVFDLTIGRSPNKKKPSSEGFFLYQTVVFSAFSILHICVITLSTLK